MCKHQDLQRLTFFHVDEHDTNDVLADVAAGQPVANGPAWFVMRTPYRPEQMSWVDKDVMCDLGRADLDVPASVWPTFGELIGSVPAREAFEALMSATRD